MKRVSETSGKPPGERLGVVGEKRRPVVPGSASFKSPCAAPQFRPRMGHAGEEARKRASEGLRLEMRQQEARLASPSQIQPRGL